MLMSSFSADTPFHGPARQEVRALLRPSLLGEKPYGAPQLQVPVLLNTNENSYPLPEVVVHDIAESLAANASQLNRYPDREFTELRVALAGYLRSVTGADLHESQIWAGNGSNEILTHVVQAFGGDRGALGFTPSYAMYRNYCLVNTTPWIDGMRAMSGADVPYELTAADAVAQVERRDPAIVFIASPNNPTGTAVDLEVIEAVYAAAPRSIVVVDEAYGEFSRPGRASALTLLEGRSRMVVSRTMSKAFSLAGGRLGYLAAAPELVDALRLVRLPYHLSLQSQLVALAALRHADALLAEVETLRQQRDRIVEALAEMGLSPVPSDANFVLFGGLADEMVVWRDLLKRGVLVREVGISGHLRVTVGNPDETTAFLSAIRELVVPEYLP